MSKEVLRKEYRLGHSKFNPFLFADVGEEKSGLQLTVLSALARLGFDPWGEAARLSELPKEDATVALTHTIAELPEGNWTASDARSIAVRLAEYLPRPGTTSPESSQGDGAADDQPTKPARNLLLWSALAGAALTILLQLLGD